ncbi:hypothetical protein WMY93_027837 [Mugilogobius chulae]|uniref:G-protein coupled receptors family 1 profile domain-containing protein n=1 Tax=Mugilogobius chulae TaxID=88201 RepID=A0AAW0N0V0_9GOBI
MAELNLSLSLSGWSALAHRLLLNESALNRTHEDDLEVNTDIYSKVTVTLIYALLFVVGCLGNTFTLWTLCTRRSSRRSMQNLQSTVHYHLASLAVSDLLILVLSMPIELYNFIWFHRPWVFGDTVCRAYYFLRDACSYATALNIVSLSVERYMAICHPFKAKSVMSRSRTKKLISAMWAASFALATPMLVVMGQDTRQLCTCIVSVVTLKTVLQRSSEALDSVTFSVKLNITSHSLINDVFIKLYSGTLETNKSYCIIIITQWSMETQKEKGEKREEEEKLKREEEEKERE